MCFGSDTPALLYETGGGSPPSAPAHSARPIQNHHGADFHDFHFARPSPSQMQNICDGRTLVQKWHFQNHAPHSSRKHIFDFQHFSYRCKCPQFMFCCQHRSLSSCFDRHTGLSEFALSLVTCAQLSSWARTADTHHFIRCAFLRICHF